MTTNTDLISRRALLRGLDCLSVKNVTDDNMVEIVTGLFDIFRAAIIYAPTVDHAQKEQEPVAWLADCEPHMIELLNWDERNIIITDKNHLSDYIGTDEEPSGYVITPLYTSPPKREWIGLSEEDKYNYWNKYHTTKEMMLAIEAKLKELNT